MIGLIFGSEPWKTNMNRSSLLLLNVLVAGACASGGPTTPAPQPTQPPVTVAPVTPEPPPPAATGAREAAANWQLLDAASDRVPGISLERARRELLANKQPKRTVV